MTPMIDILLVLLIIFMVITPMSPDGLNALLPQPATKQRVAAPTTIVVQIQHRAGDMRPVYKINEANVAYADLSSTLQGILAARADKVLFVKGDPQLEFATIADAINLAKAAGAAHIGVITPGSVAR